MVSDWYSEYITKTEISLARLSDNLYLCGFLPSKSSATGQSTKLKAPSPSTGEGWGEDEKDRNINILCPLSFTLLNPCFAGAATGGI